MRFKRVVSSPSKKLQAIDDDPASVRDLIASGFGPETALCMHDGNGVLYILAERDGEEVWLKLKYN
jgi:hypothetical protein